MFVNTVPLIVNGLGQAFIDLGHEACYVCLDSEESLLPYLEKFSPDYVFNDGGINRFPKLFPLLDKLNIPHIYWAIEDPVSFKELSLPYAMKSRHVFTPCVECISAYGGQGINASLLMFACHPAFHQKVSRDPLYSQDLIFIGNNYDYHSARMNGVNTVLQPLIQKGYDLRIYGNDWWLDSNRAFHISPDIYGGYLPNFKLPAACSSASIMLGLHSVDTSLTMMSMRTFEILGSGGFLLTQWTPAIEQYFKNHHHLVWTRSAEETLDLVDYYLDKPLLREQIAMKGQEEVYARHTYHHRVREIIPILGKSIPRPAKLELKSRAKIKVLKKHRINLH